MVFKILLVVSVIFFVDNLFFLMFKNCFDVCKIFGILWYKKLLKWVIVLGYFIKCLKMFLVEVIFSFICLIFFKFCDLFVSLFK